MLHLFYDRLRFFGHQWQILRDSVKVFQFLRINSVTFSSIIKLDNLSIFLVAKNSISIDLYRLLF